MRKQQKLMEQEKPVLLSSTGKSGTTYILMRDLPHEALVLN